MHTTHYKEVPDHWKAPVGPYYQAPPEYGGEWWLVNPFTVSEPWLYQDWKPKQEELPEGFVKLFGVRPKWTDYRKVKGGYRAFQVATVEWEQELRFFKGVGMPEWVSQSALSSALAVYEEWNMGRPTFYETNTGWMGRFLESQIMDHDSSAYQVVKYPHHTVSQYQINLFLDHDIRPEKWHPFVPPSVFLTEGDAQKEIERRLREASARSRRTVPINGGS